MGKGAPEPESTLAAGDGRYAIVVARWNGDITSRLRDGAIETLQRHGATDAQIDVFPVPGAFELPLAADRLAQGGDYVAVICLGVVIQGETLHHEYINSAVAHALMESGLQAGIPVIFGVLTVRNREQAEARAGGSVGHKGVDAAQAAMEMVALLNRIDAQ